MLAESGMAEEMRSLIPVLKVGEHVSEKFRGLAFNREESASEWETIRDEVLRHLGISAVEFEDLRDDLVGLLGDHP